MRVITTMMKAQLVGSLTRIYQTEVGDRVEGDVLLLAERTTLHDRLVILGE